jgi:hypothetical protein
MEGIVSLKPLYDFARKYPHNEAAIKVDRTTTLGNEYRRKCAALIESVPREQGLYLWGFYNANGFWTNIYVGKTERGTSSNLYTRLYKELTAERACIWREVYTYKQLRQICNRIHPPQTRKANLRAWDRHVEKAGATHIFWIALPSKDSAELKAIEKDLIESMNPTGNRQRATPPEHLREDTKQAFGFLREMIHRDENRRSRFRLDLHKNFWKTL